ncbi:Down syndrome cell adhesion molecule-like protein Dscam2 [Schistocerca serialis cubense]|uniref:Down syndrome cell adhesion molecule-like protein Dscam2 n=1 Tax=Schistocerca serialis cubense TaxID=2023355 RepID=UPI00214EF765|nr:Down syndrome cell adhesion molecule-like protein Dscam2 [Schistocerca serialis cubense]
MSATAVMCLNQLMISGTICAEAAPFLIGIDFLGWCVALGSREEASQGPVFLQEPPHRADFSNSSGVAIHCAAHGKPPPRISWLLSDGSEASAVSGLRQVLDNGTLLLAPFPAERYRPEVHSAAYRCAAHNSAGTIVSRRVQVRAAVEKQHYEVQVYDEFVMVGNTAVLRCHVPSLVRDHVVVTSWLRGNAERIVTDIQSGGRYSVFPSGELHIRHVTQADGALPYRCETRHLLTGKSRLSISAARLLVTSPQSSVPPRITDSRSHVQARHRQPVELPCAAQGFPLPSYTWFRSQGASSQRVALEDRVRQVGGSLFLAAALLRDSGRYVCVVNNSVGAERASTSLLVTTPLSAYVSPQQQTVDVGRPAQLNCSTEGHPQLAVSWLKDGRPLHTSSRVRLLTPQTLRIEHVEQHDAGMYQCVVSNNDETAQGTAQISLGDAAPVLVKTFGAATLTPGSAWSAECEAAGSPLPSVSWRRDGHALTTSQQHTLQVSVQAGSASVRGRLSLSAVRPEDGGVYECVASSAAGAASHAAPLHVVGPPHVRPMPDQRVVAHTDAAFHCRVTGYPISQIRWEKEGTTLPDNDRQQVFQNGTLIIQNMQKHSDEGGYVCVATNPDGLTSRSKLNIQVLEPPQIDPISTKPDLQRGMRTHLSCIVSKGDLPIEISWLKDGAPVPEDEEVSEKTIDDYSSTLSFRRLAPRHAGNYSCHAANAAASAHYTVQVTVNEPPSWKRQPKDTQVEAGRSVTLPCSADGSPVPRILWKKDSGSSPPNFQDVSMLMSNYKILDNGSLWIHSARPMDKGHYLCQAANGFGIGLSKIVYVDVRG